MINIKFMFVLTFGLTYFTLCIGLQSRPTGQLFREDTEVWIADHMLKLTRSILHLEQHLLSLYQSLNRTRTTQCESGNYTLLPAPRPTTALTFRVNFRRLFPAPPCVSLNLHTLEVNLQGHDVTTRSRKVTQRGFEGVVTLGCHARVYTLSVAYIACWVP